jgi:RNA polymerase sigma-70 factor (ECF subfamily)
MPAVVINVPASTPQALTRLLRDDAELEMPPFSTWFRERDAVGRFVCAQIFGPPGAFRMVPTNANGQPAVAAYRCGDDGVYRAHAVHVLTATVTGIARIVAFLDPGLFPQFGLPHVHPSPAITPS